MTCSSYLLIFIIQVNGRNIDGATPLCDACSSGHVEVVQLLLENGAVVNPPLLLTSPLHEAVLRGKCFRFIDYVVTVLQTESGKSDNFPYYSFKTYVAKDPLNCLTETVLVREHMLIRNL